MPDSIILVITQYYFIKVLFKDKFSLQKYRIIYILI